MQTDENENVKKFCALLFFIIFTIDGTGENVVNRSAKCRTIGSCMVRWDLYYYYLKWWKKIRTRMLQPFWRRVNFEGEKSQHSTISMGELRCVAPFKLSLYSLIESNLHANAYMNRRQRFAMFSYFFSSLRSFFFFVRFYCSCVSAAFIFRSLSLPSSPRSRLEAQAKCHACHHITNSTNTKWMNAASILAHSPSLAFSISAAHMHASICTLHGFTTLHALSIILIS